MCGLGMLIQRVKTLCYHFLNLDAYFTYFALQFWGCNVRIGNTSSNSALLCQLDGQKNRQLKWMICDKQALKYDNMT